MIARTGVWTPLATCLVAWGLSAANPASFRGARHHVFDLDPSTAAGAPEIPAVERSTGRRVELTRRVVLHVAVGIDPDALAARHGLRREWSPDGRTVVYRAVDAASAIRAAERLGREPGVLAAMPGLRRHNAKPAFAWAAAPNDPYFPQQWSLDNSGNGYGQPPDTSDLNLRGAWAIHRGRGVVIGVADDGMDARHPDLQAAYRADLAHNFFTDLDLGAHSLSSQYHGTAVGGLAAAQGNNRAGISGAAPAASLTSWVIFDANDDLPETTRLAAAFLRGSGTVAVQNHSWGNADFDFLEPTFVERVAISNAVSTARFNLGTVMVRASGNTRARNYFGRSGVGDANLDGFANEPGAITVASVRRDGVVASYSTPGACILVAAPGGEATEGSQLFMLDPVGNSGVTSVASAGNELANYTYGSRAGTGTSFSTPQVSGIVALMLGANPDLRLADCQRLLALSARPLYPGDPDLKENGAGLRVSHNVGYGVPDAGRAVRLAAAFHRSPQRVSVVVSNSVVPLAIPDDGLRVGILGAADPNLPASVPASGGSGIHPDQPTPALALIDVGQATAPIARDLHGAAALAFRRPNTFAQKIQFAAQAGAAFVVIANTDLGNERLLMLSTDFAAVPAVMVGAADGALLQSVARTDPAARFRLELDSARIEFQVTNMLSLDWVRVHLGIVHPRMGDLRVTLRSPAGTTSVLQRAGNQTTPQLEDWYYSSALHRLEGSAGTWTLAVTDEATGSTGTVRTAELGLTGIPILDTDGDGMDDDWERAHFGSLAANPAHDPDGDGVGNAVEAYLGTNPLSHDRPLVSRLDPDGARLRLSFPAVGGARYRIETAASPGGPWEILGDASYRGDEGSWFVPSGGEPAFYRVNRLPDRSSHLP